MESKDGGAAQSERPWIAAIGMIIIWVLIWQLWRDDVYRDVLLAQSGEMNLLDLVFYPSIRELFFDPPWTTPYRKAIWWRLAVSIVGMVWLFRGRAASLRRFVLLAAGAILVGVFCRTTLALGMTLIAEWDLTLIGRVTDLLWGAELWVAASIVVTWLINASHHPPPPIRIGSWTAGFAVLPVFTGLLSIALHSRSFPFSGPLSAQLDRLPHLVPDAVHIAVILLCLLLVGGSTRLVRPARMQTALAATIVIAFAGLVVSGWLGQSPDLPRVWYRGLHSLSQGLITGAIAASILHEAMLQLPNSGEHDNGEQGA